MRVDGGTLPAARAATDLVIEELPDELLVYDVANHQAHCLNRAAAEVFRACRDGRSLDELRARLVAADLPATDEAITLALDQLRDTKLLVAAPVRDVAALSRRDALRRMAFIAGAAAALPLVQSIVAPSKAQAASCGGVGQPCCNGSCDPGLICNGNCQPGD